MQISTAYSLPKLLAGQYMLTAVLRETPNTVVYAATQKDLRRDVVVESLRPELMADPYKVQAFIETAKAQSRMGGKFIALVLEFLRAENTWHIARERIQGAPLDDLLSSGETVTVATWCELMLTLIRSCIRHDMLGVATAPFSLQNAYYMGLGFRLDNLAESGVRKPCSSCRDIRNAARAILPNVDAACVHAHDLTIILNNILQSTHQTTLTALDVYAEFIRLQMLVNRG